MASEHRVPPSSAPLAAVDAARVQTFLANTLPARADHPRPGCLYIQGENGTWDAHLEGNYHIRGIPTSIAQRICCTTHPAPGFYYLWNDVGCYTIIPKEAVFAGPPPRRQGTMHQHSIFMDLDHDMNSRYRQYHIFQPYGSAREQPVSNGQRVSSELQSQHQQLWHGPLDHFGGSQSRNGSRRDQRPVHRPSNHLHRSDVPDGTNLETVQAHQPENNGLVTGHDREEGSGQRQQGQNSMLTPELLENHSHLMLPIYQNEYGSHGGHVAASAYHAVQPQNSPFVDGPQAQENADVSPSSTVGNGGPLLPGVANNQTINPQDLGRDIRFRD